jgi:endonuclease YncB( thermonuclease family)
MQKKVAITILMAFLMFLGGLFPVVAGDSVYGKITEVKSAGIVLLDNGGPKPFVIQIIGIDVPKTGPIASEAKQFVTTLVLNKNARARIESRAQNGDLVARLLADDSVTGTRDVGLELIRAGLARRRKGEDAQFGYKYGELAGAEREAQRVRRGLWKTTNP